MIANDHRTNHHTINELLAVREPLVKHEIYEHAGDADVHPQRPGPARDGAMLIVAAPQSSAQCDDDHGNNHDGERHVGNEDNQINHMPKVARRGNGYPQRDNENISSTPRNSAEATTAAIMQARWAAILPRIIKVTTDEQQDGAGSVQACDQGREVGVLFNGSYFGDHTFVVKPQSSLGNQAAGLVVRRFAIRNASPNMTSENRSSVAMAEGRGKRRIHRRDRASRAVLRLHRSADSCTLATRIQPEARLMGKHGAGQKPQAESETD
jgi:hypothetical protein